MLTHLPLDKIPAISQTIFSDAFLWMKSFVFWSNSIEVCWRCSWSRPTGDAPTTSEWSTISLPTKLRLILEIWRFFFRVSTCLYVYMILLVYPYTHLSTKHTAMRLTKLKSIFGTKHSNTMNHYQCVNLIFVPTTVSIIGSILQKSFFVYECVLQDSFRRTHLNVIRSHD